MPGAGQLTEAQIREIALKSIEVLDGLGPKIQWLHSYVTDDKVYCVYLAPDEETVREHARLRAPFRVIASLPSGASSIRSTIASRRIFEHPLYSASSRNAYPMASSRLISRPSCSVVPAAGPRA